MDCCIHFQVYETEILKRDAEETNSKTESTEIDHNLLIFQEENIHCKFCFRKNLFIYNFSEFLF